MQISNQTTKPWIEILTNKYMYTTVFDPFAFKKSKMGFNLNIKHKNRKNRK